MTPSSGCTAPTSTLTRVDLPAPFAPIRPTTSPGATSKSTARNACVEPKRFDTPRTATPDGAGPARGGHGRGRHVDCGEVGDRRPARLGEARLLHRLGDLKPGGFGRAKFGGAVGQEQDRVRRVPIARPIAT